MPAGHLGVGVVLGGVAGLFVAFNAFGDPIARTGFACLAAAWLFTGFKAYQAIRIGNVGFYRRWMVRNFALTFAAVTLRFWLPGLVVAGVSMEIAYPVIAWLSWVPICSSRSCSSARRIRTSCSQRRQTGTDDATRDAQKYRI